MILPSYHQIFVDQYTSLDGLGLALALRSLLLRSHCSHPGTALWGDSDRVGQVYNGRDRST